MGLLLDILVVVRNRHRITKMMEFSNQVLEIITEHRLMDHSERDTMAKLDILYDAYIWELTIDKEVEVNVPTAD